MGAPHRYHQETETMHWLTWMLPSCHTLSGVHCKWSTRGHVLLKPHGITIFTFYATPLTYTGAQDKSCCSIVRAITSLVMKHDPYASPPGDLRLQFKQWQKSSLESPNLNSSLLDTVSLDADHRMRRVNIDSAHQHQIHTSFQQFLGDEYRVNEVPQVHCFELKALPGGHPPR